MRFWNKRQNMDRNPGRASKRSPSWMEGPELFLVLSLIFIVATGSIVLTSRFATYRNKANSVALQKEQLREAEKKIEELLRMEQMLESPEAQEKLLREKMDYSRDNEIIFEFEPVEGSVQE